MKAVYRHELLSQFTSLSACVFIAFLLLFAGIYTMAINIRSGIASFEYVLSDMSFTFMIIVPVLTMRSIAEEKRQKTDNLLYSLPISMADVVLGKYFAMLTVFVIPVLVMGTYPVMLSAYGNVNLPAAFSALLGFYLLGAALIAVGMFVSSLTESQAVAAGLCFVLLLINYFLSSLSGFLSATAFSSLLTLTIAALLLSILVERMTKNSLAALLTAAVLLAVLMFTYTLFQDKFAGLVPAFMENLSLFARFEDMTGGVLDLRTLVLFLSVAGVFLYMTVQSLEKRRWSET